MVEIWKDVVGYTGEYEVSNLGQVKSLDKIICQKNRSPYVNKERILKPNLGRDGYPAVILCSNGKIKRIPIHRLVAMCFIPNPENKKCVNHINGVRSDNRVENLEWATHRENNVHTHINNKTKKTSKYPGVSKMSYGDKWCTVFSINKKLISHYHFKTEEEAYEKYLSEMGRHGVKNKYARPITPRQLWQKPYWMPDSPNYLNRN